MEEGVILYESGFVISCETADSRVSAACASNPEQEIIFISFSSAFVCLSTSSDSHCCAFWLC